MNIAKFLQLVLQNTSGGWFCLYLVCPQENKCSKVLIRTVPNIYDGTFCKKWQWLKTVYYFSQKRFIMDVWSWMRLWYAREKKLWRNICVTIRIEFLVLETKNICKRFLASLNFRPGFIACHCSRCPLTVNKDFFIFSGGPSSLPKSNIFNLTFSRQSFCWKFML